MTLRQAQGEGLLAIGTEVIYRGARHRITGRSRMQPPRYDLRAMDPRVAPAVVNNLAAGDFMVVAPSPVRLVPEPASGTCQRPCDTEPAA